MGLGQYAGGYWLQQYYGYTYSFSTGFQYVNMVSLFSYGMLDGVSIFVAMFSFYFQLFLFIFRFYSFAYFYFCYYIISFIDFVVFSFSRFPHILFYALPSASISAESPHDLSSHSDFFLLFSFYWDLSIKFYSLFFVVRSLERIILFYFFFFKLFNYNICLVKLLHQNIIKFYLLTNGVNMKVILSYFPADFIAHNVDLFLTTLKLSYKFSDYKILLPFEIFMIAFFCYFVRFIFFFVYHLQQMRKLNNLVLFLTFPQFFCTALLQSISHVRLQLIINALCLTINRLADVALGLFVRPYFPFIHVYLSISGYFIIIQSQLSDKQLRTCSLKKPLKMTLQFLNFISYFYFLFISTHELSLILNKYLDKVGQKKQKDEGQFLPSNFSQIFNII